VKFFEAFASNITNTQTASDDHTLY
jgi:hypothetical protein